MPCHLFVIAASHGYVMQAEPPARTLCRQNTEQALHSQIFDFWGNGYDNGIIITKPGRDYDKINIIDESEQNGHR